MSSLADLVPIPGGLNVGLHPCLQQTMINALGIPGPLTQHCKPPTGTVAARMKWGVNVGPFKVSGLDYAVESLAQVFAEFKQVDLQAYKAIKTAGMLCVRARRTNPRIFSNHSWGTTIDLYFGDSVVPQGVHKCHRGMLNLWQIFNRYEWYWGAGFSGDSVDSMHFELSNNAISKLSEPVEQILATKFMADVGFDEAALRAAAMPKTASAKKAVAAAKPARRVKQPADA